MDKNFGLTALGNSSIKPANSPYEAFLETFENKFFDRDYEIEFECPEFTSLCPVTGQPDFGCIYIKYVPDKKCVESKSLKLFIQSFRNFNTFHEEAVNIIRDKFIAEASPKRIEVTGRFRARGGISITVKSNYEKR